MRNLNIILVAGLMSQTMPVLGSDAFDAEALDILAEAANAQSPLTQTASVSKWTLSKIDPSKESEADIIEVLRGIPAIDIDMGLIYSRFC